MQVDIRVALVVSVALAAGDVLWRRTYHARAIASAGGALARWASRRAG